MIVITKTPSCWSYLPYQDYDILHQLRHLYEEVDKADFEEMKKLKSVEIQILKHQLESLPALTKTLKIIDPCVCNLFNSLPPFYPFQGRDQRDQLLHFETESETGIFRVSILRPGPRLKFSESQFRDRVRD